MSQAPPLEHGKYTCSGHGLKVASYSRASIYELRVQTGLSPILTPKGRVAKKQRVPKQSRDWWEAQIHLYGLKCSYSTLGRMKNAFKAALEKGLTVPTDIELLEEKLNREYRSANEKYQKRLAAEHDARWFTLTTDAQRARHDLGRFLREIVVGSKVAHVLHGFGTGFEVDRAAEPLGLISQSTPGVGWIDGYTVVGTDRSRSDKEIQKLEAKVKEETLVIQQRKLETHQRHEEEIERKRLQFVKTGDGGNVMGKWVLSMPELTEFEEEGDGNDGNCASRPFWFSLGKIQVIQP